MSIWVSFLHINRPCLHVFLKLFFMLYTFNNSIILVVPPHSFINIVYYSSVCINHNLFNRVPISGHWGGFQDFVVTNNAIPKIYVQNSGVHGILWQTGYVGLGREKQITMLRFQNWSTERMAFLLLIDVFVLPFPLRPSKHSHQNL